MSNLFYSKQLKSIAWIEMGLTNTDASQLTLKRQRKVLFSWKKTNTDRVNLGGSILSEQPSFQSGLVVLNRKMGAYSCSCDLSIDKSTESYPFTGASQGTQVQ